MVDLLLDQTLRERGRGRLFVFAHNSHLRRGVSQWQLGPDLLSWWPAGAHLDALLGPRYAVIGTGVGESVANGISRAEPGTLEALLAASPGPARFIPTAGGRALPLDTLPVRSGASLNSTYFPLTAHSLADFDWLAVLDTTGYARGGPALRQPGA